MKHFTLLQLNKSIKKLISGIAQEFWITAEIAQIQASNHCYLEFVQKEENKVIAKARATIWERQLTGIEKKIDGNIWAILKKGSKVLVKVKVTFHEVHGLSLNIVELDPSYTLGELELKRQESIKKLIENNLIDLQKSLVLPELIQRIAVISSIEAAGYSDFMDQLINNDYGYQFSTMLFDAPVQGEKAEGEIISQLSKVNSKEFDVIIIIRGGGSRLDLEVFNSYSIAETIANLSIPVLTGIGHQRDESVCDLVAHSPLKTPTAVAEFILQRALMFESQLNLCFESIIILSRELLVNERNSIKEMKFHLQRLTGDRIQNEQIKLANSKVLLKTITKHLIENEKNILKLIENQVKFLDPKTILARGYTLTLKNEQIVQVDDELEVGDEITTLTSLQKIKSVVKEIKSRHGK